MASIISFCHRRGPPVARFLTSKNAPFARRIEDLVAGHATLELIAKVLISAER
jgi:hypothetical protein